MNKGYIVMKKGYEYDDNTYNETDGGHPKVVCFSKEDAIRKVKELNIKEYQEVSLLDYVYEDDCLNVEWIEFESFNKSLIDKYGEIPKTWSWDNTENRLHPSANQDEIDEYCRMVSVSFYEITDVDIDMSSWRDIQITQILD